MARSVQLKKPKKRRILGGVGTHGDTHHAAVVLLNGTRVADAEFPATAAGYGLLLAWLRSFGRLVAVGVEGTGASSSGGSSAGSGSDVSSNVDASDVDASDVDTSDVDASDVGRVRVRDKEHPRVRYQSDRRYGAHRRFKGLQSELLPSCHCPLSLEPHPRIEA